MACSRPDTARSNPKDIGELAEPLRSRIYTVTLDAPTKGLVLVSGYRDPGRQWDLRHDRCPGRECDRGCRGFPVTAIPAQFIGGQWVGGSLHQHRRAADMGGRELGWLIEHRLEYGLGLTVSSENWHFEASGRDTRTGRAIPAPTRRIIPWPGSGPAPSEEDEDMPLNDADLDKIGRLIDTRLLAHGMKVVAAGDKADDDEHGDILSLLRRTFGFARGLAEKEDGALPSDKKVRDRAAEIDADLRRQT